MTLLPVLPILVPLLTAALLVLIGPRLSAQRGVSIAGASALMGVAFWLLTVVLTGGTQVLHVGGWPAPFGIAIVADLFSAIMVAIAAFIGLGVAIYSLADIDSDRVRWGFHPLYHALLVGVCGAFLTGDLFNLFVWFEVMLMASFVLLVLGGGKAQIQGGLKYLTLNILASGLFLTALGILYGKTGTLNMADLASKIANVGSGAAFSSVMLLLAAFGIKAGLFPLFFWLPASYHTPPTAISAVFAGLLTKVGVYAMIRVFTLFDTGQIPQLHAILMGLSVLTMLTGVLGAAAQFDIRRILSFHIISQIGYMTLGLAFFSEAAIAAAIFYIVHHIIVKTNLFLIGGAIERLRGTGHLKSLGGLCYDHPWLAVLFMIPALSLAGIPPLSGFFAKFTLIAAGLSVGAYVAIAAALLAGVLTLFSMTKIWAEAFWKSPPTSGPKANARLPLAMGLPIVAMALVTISIGLAPELLLEPAKRAAGELLDRESYIHAVIGGAR